MNPSHTWSHPPGATTWWQCAKCGLLIESDPASEFYFGPCNK